MENPGFQDSDQSMYESSLGICRPAAMPRPRRPHNLATFQHPHSHGTVITHAHSPPGVLHGLPAATTAHSNTLSHTQLANNGTHHGIPATAHLHGGRVVGVTGVPNSAQSTPTGTPCSGSFPVASPQPLYSCQAPRGHDHVYQCPGHRSDHHHHHTTEGSSSDLASEHHHHLHHHNHHLQQQQQQQQHHHHSHQQQQGEHPPLDLRGDVQLQQHHFHHPVEAQQQQQQQQQQHYMNHREHPVVEIRESRQASTTSTEYHYGGSDYSSTEPIYAQPHLQAAHDGQSSSSPARTPPPLAYATMRGSLRASSSSSSTHHHAHGTPARFLVRTDSTGASTSSSTLPTVSALMAMDSTPTQQQQQKQQQQSRTRSSGGVGGTNHLHHHRHHDFTKVATLSSGSAPSTPAKAKGNGVLGAWRVKYLEGTGGNRKAALLLGLLVLLLILVLGGLAAVLYLTLGGGFGAIVGQPPQLVHLTEKGSSIVTGQFRITNQNFWHGLADPNSDSFRALSKSIEKEMDHLFLNSVWAREFNRSEVISLSDGSLVVRARFHLNTPDTSAAKKLGSVFLRGLHKRHSQEWLGPFTIDISSIRFAEVLVDSTSPVFSSSPTPLSHSTFTTTTAYTRTMTREGKPSVSRKPSSRRPNVGWGEWGPWSSCVPCSPQYDQFRTRKCRLDDGKGILLSNIELCLPEGIVSHHQGSRDRETRPCQCDFPEAAEVEEKEKEDEYVDELEEELESTTETTSVKSSSSTSKLRGKKTEQDQIKEETIDEENYRTGICETCDPGEVCVALEGESFPICRMPKNPNDQTGCGGLCKEDVEVCQALGSRAFQCHSTSQCLDDEWRCADRLCIPQEKRCDGHFNCYDRSDEKMCKCSSDEFHCGNQTSCLPLSAKCDGNVDCWDGLDEANCSNGTGDASILPPSVTGVTRVGTSVMNRTAIGLSSLSHRERELLS